ncbi:hypothetical protein KAFR_0C05980 [Kazachstania africana CBS 2517]|uniref:RING-type domain-containing protein n=1 Tax=Kazachstania africana (strain ATCC 22294 / BCRC 22015 / CBS 2517 / CECT 1963 / NBRC 1671 / NRRL Y-8276) TaxID=1071382 RepID=H2AT89_KAZAF|nr:hypothetical protein KAFR_0C05980 [Kazachstania africana CBS 2517]CCF57589.1 hypothetical protein KAFR_0C05980 [Kazachstania africana CBS 2517]
MSESNKSGANSSGANSNKPKRNFRRTQGPQVSKAKLEKKRQDHRHGSSKADDDDDELCLICAEKLKFIGLTPCNHRTCHKCSFRQLSLYQKSICLVCRSDVATVIYTDQKQSQFKDFDVNNTSQFYYKDEKYNVFFTSKEAAGATLNLLKFICQVCDSNDEIDYESYQKLQSHLKSEHNKSICMICAQHKHAFPIELKIFTPNQLRNHQSKGDSTIGFKGHPLCAFCSGRRFYSDDELYLHMRESHEKCHICDKIDHSSPQYFKDYDQLFDHFRNFHYACTVQSCLDNKFVVFADELELQAHILQEHGSIIGGKPKFFQSELSTFISAPSRVIRETNVTQNNESLLAGENESPELKALRMEERAKYYLDNSEDDFIRFLHLNSEYDSGKLTAEKLLNSYKELFTTPQSDVYLLIRNLSVQYSKDSKKFKELNAIYNAQEQRRQRSEALPSLPTDGFAPVASSVWSKTGSTTSRSASSSRTNLRNLPTLESPSPNHDPFRNPYNIKSYSKLGKPLTKKTSPQQVSRSSPSVNSVNFTPNYLESKRQQSPAANTLSQKADKLSQLNLPSLPTPKPKVYIRPVNPQTMPDPKQWGKQRDTSPQVEDEFANLNISSNAAGGNKGKKNKNKQKQLLFHIGI